MCEYLICHVETVHCSVKSPHLPISYIHLIFNYILLIDVITKCFQKSFDDVSSVLHHLRDGST